MKLLYTLLLLAAFHSLAAQNITQIEYFIDTDKGHGQNTLVNVSPGADVEVEFTVPLTNVPPGFHLLYLRAKNSANNWGITSQKAIYVDRVDRPADIVAVEYFLDTDLGPGKNTPIPLGDTATDVTADYLIDLSNVTPGFHLLFIRAKDNNGSWGITSQKAVYVDKGKSNANIVRLDYAYQNSNGDISATYGYVVPEPAPAVDLTFPATVEGLADNQAYTLLIYATNENGIRSLVNALDFTYSPVVPINITLSKTDIDCNGAKNGTITATASGGEGTLGQLYGLGHAAFDPY